MGTEHLRRTATTTAPEAATDQEQQAAGPSAPLPVAVPLTVGHADDPAEAAADRMADSALARLAGAGTGAGDGAGAGGGTGGDEHRHGPGCEHLRRLPGGAGAPEIGRAGGDLDPETTDAINNRRPAGQSLPGGVLQRMETAFGRDLSGVRVHSDDKASALSESVSARAFTTGRDIFFGAGEFRPETAGGERVLAHEIAHVVQNSGGTAPVQRLFGKKKNKDAKGAKGVKVDADADTTTDTTAPVTTKAPVKPSDVPGNEGLASVTTAAFAAAKPLNTDYADWENQVKAWVPQDHQKKIADIGDRGNRSKGDADKRSLKDLLRAYIMQAYTAIIEDKITDPVETSTGEYRALTSDEKKLTASRYFPKTLQNRDLWSGLLDKGPYAPETQSFLQEEGFGAAIVRSPVEKAADGGGPRIDVRATFIGGEILGAPRRMHLFIIYTSSDGDQTLFRGGPDENDVYTEVLVAPYESGLTDWDPSAPSVSVLKGEKAKEKFDGLVEASKHIEGMKVPYVGATPGLNAGGLGGLEAFVSGENCNSVAWTLLKRAGIPQKKPSGLHPGWGHMLGDLLKQGAAKMPAKEATTGLPTTLAGGATDAIQVMADRQSKEKLVTLPGGSNVEHILIDNGMAKIKFGAKGSIGWVKVASVRKPVKPGKPGAFWLTGKATDFSQVKGTTGYVYGGEPVEVLDPGFVAGTKGEVNVRTKDADTGEVYEGTVDGSKLTSVDPKDKASGFAPTDQPDESSSDQSSSEESSSEEEQPKGKAPVKGGAMGGGMKIRVDDSDSDSESESAEDTPKIIAKFDADQLIPMYNRDGSKHKFGGITNPKGKPVGATGRFKDLVDGRRMVEFVWEGTAAWIPERDWKRIFLKDYPVA